MSSWYGDMALPNTYYGKYNVFVVWGHGFAQYILWKIWWYGDMALPNTYYGKYNVFVVWGHGFAQYVLWKI